LIEVSKQVPELARILDAGEHHLVTGNERLGGSTRYLLSVSSFHVTIAFFMAGE
jgi:hypothetical protein